MAGTHHGLTRFDQLMKTCLHGDGPARPFAQTLGRLLPPNPVHIKNITHADVIHALDDLSQGMSATVNEDGPADAGMTFLGQFIDHDVTLDATSALGTRIDPATIPNVRTPALDLDCVYGAGPEASNILYGEGEQEQMLLYGRDENPLDLARTCAGKALIGDPRNDENIIVAQVHSLFIELHNILMSKVMENDGPAADIRACAHDGISKQVWMDHVKKKLESFEEVRRFIRLHYQWIVWNEFLPAFVDKACLERAATEHLFGWDAPVMPVEFSGACYRFGHATTQFEYTLTEGGTPQQLFETLGFGPRPEHANLTMDLFFTHSHGPDAQKARPVGPKLGEPLLNLPFVHEEIELAEIGETLTLPQSRNLALRNMVRDRYTYQLASGQHVATRLGTPEVGVPDELKSKGFDKTPLWFYSLQEAEQHGHGKLTGAGGAIVATVFANLLKRDATTVWHLPHFKPWDGFGGQPSCIAGIAAYVRDHRDHVIHPEKLRCG
ncbi:peroxidase family protein [Jannaschia aquimarina]|uniref:Animal heme peroxidase n=1 Tax=Jannaschia aquimarina TaxID=935700 RepID=A0A0D1D2D3_9RHOB|nr:peroxidase family protein [Jannaschia aquimarina]KIT14268.1 Animal heme peroxidase [Jannaschia aquimarina]SNS49603.1 Animal haem peroxidase [Jannaschia aquimarina]